MLRAASSCSGAAASVAPTSARSSPGAGGVKPQIFGTCFFLAEAHGPRRAAPAQAPAAHGAKFPLPSYPSPLPSFQALQKSCRAPCPAVPAAFLPKGFPLSPPCGLCSPPWCRSAPCGCVGATAPGSGTARAASAPRSDSPAGVWRAGGISRGAGHAGTSHVGSAGCSRAAAPASSWLSGFPKSPRRGFLPPPAFCCLSLPCPEPCFSSLPCPGWLLGCPCIR